MNKGNKNILLITGGVILVFLVLILMNSSKQQSSWEETYSLSEKSPYDLYFFHELMKTRTDSSEVILIQDSLKQQLNELDSGNVYFYVGDNMHLDYEEYDAITSFVQKGNSAFISINNFNYFLTNVLFSNSTMESYRSKGIQIKSTTSDQKHSLIYEKYGDTLTKTWEHFAPNIFEDYSGEILATFNEKPVFVQINYGQGIFYLCSVPLLFTNFHLYPKSGLELAESMLPQADNKIIIDQYSHQVFEFVHNDETGNREKKRSMLEFILKNKSLAWAYYLVLLLSLLFIFFRSKRKHPIIPSIRKKNNNTMNFVEAVSKLYINTGSHSSLLKLKRIQFFRFVKERYGLTTNKIDAVFIQDLIKKSGLKTELLTELTGLLKPATYKTISNEELIRLEDLLEYFTKNCK